MKSERRKRGRQGSSRPPVGVSGKTLRKIQSQKQKVEQRFLLSAQTVEAVRPLWLPPRRLLFPWPWTDIKIWQHLGQILDAAGLPNGPKSKFHKLRKTCASHIAKVLWDCNHSKTLKAVLQTEFKQSTYSAANSPINVQSDRRRGASVFLSPPAPIIRLSSHTNLST